MSHEATIWAIKQTGKGLSPGAKLVLWHLADRHNPDFGCFPKQDRLAADCEMSRSTVNEHLSTLEAKGLIRRERRTDPRTRRQMPTRYVFAFEAEFGDEPPVGGGVSGGGASGAGGRADRHRAVRGSDSASADHAQQQENGTKKAVEKPCPESGHGSETVSEIAEEPCPEIGESRVRLSGHVEPVREPLRDCVGGASAAHIPKGFEDFWKAHPRPRDRDKSIKLFADAVEAGVDPKRITKAAERYADENAGNKAMYVAYSSNWLEARRWEDYPNDPAVHADEVGIAKAATFWASKIKSGRYVPPSAVSASLASCMLTNGLVTIDQMRRAGLNP